MPFQKGDPNINRAGRPKKKRALTQALESALNKSVELPDGTRVNGKRYMASMAIQAVTTGKVTLANGVTLELSPEDMLFFWKFAYQQVDGPPPQALEHSGIDGEAIKVMFEYANNDSENVSETD